MKDYTYGMIILSNIEFLASKKKHELLLRRQGLQTVGCYEMLAQPKYKRKLQYVPQALRKGNGDYHYSGSDQLRYYVDYPYISKD